MTLPDRRRGLDALIPTSPRLPTAEEAQADALRGIAAAVVRARASTDHMGRLRPEAGGDLLAECERHLSALIVVGAVPAPADPDRRTLT